MVHISAEPNQNTLNIAVLGVFANYIQLHPVSEDNDYPDDPEIPLQIRIAKHCWETCQEELQNAMAAAGIDDIRGARRLLDLVFNIDNDHSIIRLAEEAMRLANIEPVRLAWEMDP